MKIDMEGQPETSFKVNIFMQNHSAAIRYGIALGVSLLAFTITELLFPLFHSPVYFLSLVAVMISALFGGAGAGLLATLLSVVSFIYSFLPLTLHLYAYSTSDLIRLGLFLLFSLLICWVSASFRSSYRNGEIARMEAEAANHYKSKLVSNVSHDLRTPLNAIIGYSSLLLDGTYGPVLMKQAFALEGIHRNAGDLLRMINDILDLAKIESGRMSASLAPVKLSGLIKEVLSELKPLSDQKGLSVECLISEPLPYIESDRIKIKQILVNLISNAIKFTDRGKILVTARNREQCNDVEVVVQDTGIGIPDEALPKIFEAFYQVDNIGKPKGSGLGLAIVKETVHLLKGEIRVDSDYGKGTTFTILLPYRFSS